MTGRKAATSERRYQALFEASPSMLFEVASDGVMLAVSQHGAAKLGYPVDELVGRSVFEVFHPEERESVREQIAECVERPGTVVERTHRKVHRDGRPLWVREAARGVVREDGEVRILIACSDVTELEAARETVESARRVLEERTLDQAQALREQHSALMESDSLLRSIAENTPDHIMLLDLDGTIHYINRTVPDLSVSEVIGTKVYQHIEPRFHHDMRSCFAEVAASGRPGRYDVDYRRADGGTAIFESRVGPLLRDGTVVALVVNSSDVTERRRNEEELRRSESRYRSLVESQTELVVRWCPDGTVTFVNDAYCRLRGATESVLLGSNFLDTLSDEDRDRLRSRCRALTPGGDAEVDLRRLPNEDGQARWSEWSERGIFDRRGQLVEIQSVGRDVTRRVRALEALAASEELYRLLAENVSDVIVNVSLDLEITYASPSMTRLIGYPIDQVLGRPAAALMTAESLDLALGTLAEELEQEGQPGVDPARARTLDLQLRARDARLIWVEAKLRFLRDASGHAIGATGVLRDITAWREAQDALRDSEERFLQTQKLEAIGKLAGGMAHDFNNLLTVIQGNIELLQAALVERGLELEETTEIRRAAERGASLIGQLLAFGRKQRMVTEVIDLNGLILRTRAMLRRLIGEDVELVTELGAEPAAVEVDPGKIEQVLLNLAVNARDAMPEGGRLTIATARSAAEAPTSGTRAARAHVLLTMSDTGCGIPPADLDKVFEPFFTTKKVGEGTGLGLSTVYGIVKQSGGTIRAKSRVGSGTTFEIRLPAAREAVDRPSRDVLIAATSGSGTVLVVEDDPRVRSLVRRTLQTKGYQVIVASDGEQAIKLVTSGGVAPQLLVTDVVMPGLTGFQLAAELTRRIRGLQVLYMSGYGREAVGRRGGAHPPGLFLAKPFHPNVLLDRVRTALQAAVGSALD